MVKLKSWVPSHNRIYIIPTGWGFSLLVLILFIFLLGSGGHNIHYYLSGFTLIVIGLVCMIQTNYNLSGIEVTIDKIISAEVGGKIELHLKIRNNSQNTRFRMDLGLDKNHKVINPCHIEFLNSEQSEGHITYISAQKRGLYFIKKIRISTRFPLGLFFSWKWLYLENEYFVYPKAVGSQILHRYIHANQSTNAGDSHEGEDFNGHRQFFKGDSPKHIDWKAYARDRPLMVKVFNSGASSRYIIAYSDVKSNNQEVKLSQLCLWVFSCHRNSEIYQLELPNGKSGFGNSFEHYQKCLRMLAADGGSG